jgi:hypothetical protein
MSSEEHPSQPRPASPSTHFIFEHNLFRAPGARFAPAADGTPSMMMNLADLDAVVPLKSLRNEFQLDGTADGDLLDKVVAGLKFVKVILPGDSIPSELLDGTASWSVEQRHHDLARGRLTVQISSWLLGQEQVIVEKESLIQLADDPAVKTRVNQAFGDIAERLGLGREKRQDVVDRVEQLGRELAYIEALRERFGILSGTVDHVNEFLKVYRRERTIHDELVRILQLLRRPVEDIRGIFDQIDAQSGEILSLLRNVDRQIPFIREARDQLHTKMMLWDPIILLWRDLPLDRSLAVEQKIRELYRFAARNFVVQKPWQLTNASFDRKD